MLGGRRRKSHTETTQEVAGMAAASAKFKVVVQKPSGGLTYDLGDSAYAIEREALDPIGAEIVEVPAKTEEEFIAAAKDADAVIARNRRITAAIIKGLRNCKVIGLGSVARTRWTWTRPPRRASWLPTCPTCSSTRWPTTPWPCSSPRIAACG